MVFQVAKLAFKMLVPILDGERFLIKAPQQRLVYVDGVAPADAAAHQ